MVAAILGILQFILFVALIPLVVSVTIAFQNEIMLLRPEYRDYFRWGIIAYVLMNLFLNDLYTPYNFGRRVVAEIFKFLGPLSQVLSYVIPFYTLLVIGVYFFIGLFLKIGPDTSSYFFIIGFAMSLHIVLSAKEVYEGDKMMFKPGYCFGMSLVYLASLLLMAFILDVSIKEFSFPHFFDYLLTKSEKLYVLVYEKLFISHL